MKVLVLAAHPDDVELSCAGTLALQTSLGYKCGIADMTKGELGTRGTAEIRMQEAAASAEILGVVARENLEMNDGFFEETRENLLKVIQVIRKYQPEMVFCNAPSDRHPDHGRAAKLVKRAAFMAGLRRIETFDEGEPQKAYRPQQVLHFIQFDDHKPDIIVNIGEHIETKIKSIMAYKSQFYDANSKEPATVISSKAFFDNVRNRSQVHGVLIGAQYGEGFIKTQDLGIEDVMQLKGTR